MTTTGGKVARGAAWMMTARIVDRLIGVVSTLVLARLLTPADFGLVAMAMTVIGLIEIAAAFGFEVSLVRAHNPPRELYDSVWTLNVLFGLGCSLATAAAAIPAAQYYHDERLVWVLLVLAGGWLIGSFSNVGTVDFSRDLNFAKEFQLLFAVRMVGFVVTLALAFHFRSFWALVIGQFSYRIARLVFSYWWHPFRPRFSTAAMRDLFHFSIWILVDKLACFGYERAADFVLGRTHGATELGYLRIGQEIGSLPGTELVAPINRALLPGASRMVEGGRLMSDVFATASGVIALMLLPACLGIVAVAEPLVLAMLGNQWLAAIPLVEIMAYCSLFVALLSNFYTALYAAGLPKVTGMISIARVIVFIPAMVYLTPSYGAWGVATASLGASVFALLFGLSISMSKLSMSLRYYLSVLWRPVIASVVMLYCVREFVEYYDTHGAAARVLVELVTGVAIGVVVYTLSIALMYFGAGRPKGAESLLLERVVGLLRR